MSTKRAPRRTAEQVASDPLVAVTMRFPQSVVDAARKQADERGESLSSAVRAFLRRYAK